MMMAKRALPLLMTILLLSYFIAYESLTSWRLANFKPILRSLPQEEREAMRWIAANTPEESHFAVMTQYAFWEDRTSEWFPVLASRRSLATVQGSEWLPDHQFQKHWEQFEALQACAKETSSCLAEWADAAGFIVTHVYIRRGCCELLRESLRESRDYRPIYHGPGADVFAHSSNE